MSPLPAEYSSHGHLNVHLTCSGHFSEQLPTLVDITVPYTFPWTPDVLPTFRYSLDVPYRPASPTGLPGPVSCLKLATHLHF